MTYAPLRDALHELNLTMRDSQQWNARNRAQQSAFGLQELQLRNQLANDAQNRKIKAAQVAQANEMMTPRAINAFDFLDDSVSTRKIIFEKNNGAVAKELSSAMGPGVSLGADGIFRGGDGQPIKLNKFQFDRVLPGLFAVATKYNDPIYQAQSNIDNINGQITELDRQLSHIPKGAVQFQAKRAEIAAQKNKLLGMRTEQQKNMEPKNILQTLRDDYENMKNFAIVASTRGANPQTMNIISGAMGQISGRIKAYEDNMLRTQLAYLNANLKKKEGDGKGQMFTAFQLNDAGDIVNAKQIPVNKKLGRGYTPYDADPSLDPKHTWVWDKAFSAQNEQIASKNKNKGTKWAARYDRLRKEFYDDYGYVLKGPLDAYNFSIAARQFDELEGTDISETDQIMEAKNYANSGQAIADYDERARQIVIANAGNKEKTDKGLANLEREWRKMYGQPSALYRKMIGAKQEAEAEFINE